MKNEKQALWLLSLLNIILLILLIYSRFFWSATGINKESYNRAVSSLKFLYNNQKILSNYQVFTEGSELNHDLELSDENGDSIQLGSIITGFSLVFRYTELNCQSCVDLLLTTLRADSSFNKINTLLLTYYKEPSYLYQFKRMNRLQYPVFSIKNTGLPPDTLNVPYLFLLDQSLKVSNVFIPEEGDTASIKQYLSFASQELGKHR